MLCLLPGLFLLGLQVTKPIGVLWAVLPLAMVQLGPAGPSVSLDLLMNFVLSMYIGIGVAIVSKILLQSTPLPKLLQRLEQQNLADLGDILRGTAYDARAFVGRGFDRFLLIQTRLPQLPNLTDEQKNILQLHILRELRIGAEIGVLRRWEYRSVQRKAMLEPLWAELEVELRQRLNGQWQQGDKSLLQRLDQALQQIFAHPEDNHCA
ncbi:fusaric acid resistance family protein, partial [Lasius niger]